MRLVVFIDPAGVEKVEIIATTEEWQEAHKLYESLRTEIERLDAAARTAAEVAENAHRQ